MSHAVDNADFWETRYSENRTPWDIGQVAPAFKKYIERQQATDMRQQATDHKHRLSVVSGPFVSGPLSVVCVLGCGLGHDAFFFAENGYKVYAFDFSDTAIKKCNELKEQKGLKNIFFNQVDFFNLKSEKKYQNYFDYVIEHTSLCAINPKRQKEYGELIKYLLKPEGKLIGLFFMKEELGGPPYGISEKEIRELFSDFKEIEKLRTEECLHTNLNGYEKFGVFQK